MKNDNENIKEADSTAVRVALWRALHVQVDVPPHVLDDEVGLQLVAPDDSWRRRPDMDPMGTRGYRASIVARARFIEDLVAEKINEGTAQYVILGAGLDTFAQRKPELASKLRIFEVDKPSAQAWKRQRLIDTGFGIPDYLRLVPVDFESRASWWNHLKTAGFNMAQPSIVACTGVTMYLTKEAVKTTLQQIATLAARSILAMTFMLPLELLPAEERAQHQMVYEKARAAGTPFLSFFAPDDMLALAREVGFRKVEHVSTADLSQRYFSGRADGLQPSTGESFLLATI